MGLARLVVCDELMEEDGVFDLIADHFNILSNVEDHNWQDYLTVLLVEGKNVPPACDEIEVTIQKTEDGKQFIREVKPIPKGLVNSHQ
jgi:hypothetical protein